MNVMMCLPFFSSQKKYDTPSMLHEAASDCVCSALYAMEVSGICLKDACSDFFMICFLLYVEACHPESLIQILSEMARVVFILTAKMCLTLSP